MTPANSPDTEVPGPDAAPDGVAPDRGGHHHLHDLAEAAIAAEREVGEHEETLEEARRHVVFRVIRVVVGLAVLGAGLALLALPGPGLVTIAAGLALLSRDVPFARRLLDKVRARLPEGEDGEVSKTFVIASVVGSVAFVALSVWWTLIR